jgi:hypothetical protein
MPYLIFNYELTISKFLHPFTLLGVVGYCRLFPWRVKLPEFENDRSPPFSAQFKNQWCYTSTFHICLCELDRDNFTIPIAEMHKAQGPGLKGDKIFCGLSVEHALFHPPGV